MPANPLEPLIEQARRLTRDHLCRGAGHFGIPVPRIDLRFDLRGQAAGQVRFPQKGRPVIRYNPALLLENGETFLNRTVPHEVAHVITYRLHKGRVRPHGPEWKAVMAVLGADSSRCHDYAVDHLKARRLTRYAYHCDCREHALTSIRHKRILAGQTYFCRACGQALAAGGKAVREDV